MRNTDKYPTPVYSKRYGVLEYYNDPPVIYENFSGDSRTMKFIFKQAGDTIEIPIVVDHYLPFKEQQDAIRDRLQEALDNN